MTDPISLSGHWEHSSKETSDSDQDGFSRMKLRYHRIEEQQLYTAHLELLRSPTTSLLNGKVKYILRETRNSCYK